MATQMITLKLDDKFLDEIDRVVKESGYQNRTEFIRSALREKIHSAKMSEALRQLSLIRGSSKKKITEEEYENAREQAFEELSKKFR